MSTSLRRLSRLGVVPATAFALVVAGCQAGLSLNTDQLEQEVQNGIQQQTGLTVTEIECPDRPLQQGDVFDCSASTADGRSLTITVTQTDANGNVSWQMREN